MSVVSTICLVVISVSLLTAGVYTVRTVNDLRRTYHPERLGQMFDQASSALSTLHDTTKLLQRTHDDDSVQTLPQMFDDARVTMEQAHASLTLGQGLLQVPELKLVLQHIPEAIDAFRESLPKNEQFYESMGHALADISWITHLSSSLSELSSSVDMLDVERLLTESQSWRNISLTTAYKFKRILGNL